MIHAEATDRSGNRSSDSVAELDIDASGPATPEISVATPGEQRHLTRIEIVGEAGAGYLLEARSVIGEIVADSERNGVLGSDGRAAESLVLRNGDYEIVSTLADAQGNRSSSAVIEAHVDVPPPSLAISRSSNLNSPLVRFTISGPATGHGTLTVSSDAADPRSVEFVLSDEGVSSVDVELPDGRWAVAASVTDFQDRPADAALADQIVDTVAPPLDVTIDQEAATRGIIRATFDVEEGAAVRVSGLPDGPQTFTNAGPSQLEVDVEGGSYGLEFVATDAAGNETRRSIDVAIPRQRSDAAIGTVLFLLLTVGAAAWLARRARRRRRTDPSLHGSTSPPSPGAWVRVVLPTGLERFDWVPTIQPSSPDGMPGLWHLLVDARGAFLGWEWHPSPSDEPALR